MKEGGKVNGRFLPPAIEGRTDGRKEDGRKERKEGGKERGKVSLGRKEVK